MITKSISFTTATDGTATASGQSVPGGAYLEAIEYLPGTTDTGATVTISDVYGGVTYTLWSLATAGTSDLRRYPRQLEVLNTSGANLTTHTRMIVMGVPKVVVSAGGAVKTGSVKLHLRQV